MNSSAIALDVMGGDHAPEAVLDGAVSACREGQLSPERLLLVGDEETIRAGLAERGAEDLDLVIRHASQVIAMGEKPAAALRGKPDSSIHVGVGALRAGQAGAFVSMGNTGAVVGAATLVLRTLPGVRRPGIAVTLELTGKPMTLLDVGANIAAKPQHLLQYGTMGVSLQRDVLGVENPRVGLLNIGEEAGKGGELLRETYQLLSESHGDSFIGNVEPGHLFQDGEGVVVTDGFTGNVVLKLMESVAAFMFQRIQSEITGHGASWGPEALANVRHQIDYSEYGGALLLGVDGVVVIGHGRSDGAAVANALELAARALDRDVNGDIVRSLEGAAR